MDLSLYMASGHECLVVSIGFGDGWSEKHSTCIDVADGIIGSIGSIGDLLDILKIFDILDILYIQETHLL